MHLDHLPHADDDTLHWRQPDVFEPRLLLVAGDRTLNLFDCVREG